MIPYQRYREVANSVDDTLPETGGIDNWVTQLVILYHKPLDAAHHMAACTQYLLNATPTFHLFLTIFLVL